MDELFKSKILNNEYVSLNLYNKVKDNYPSFDLDSYNNNVIKKIYLDNRTFFNNICKPIDENIQLDGRQLKCVIEDEDYSLILAGAGTGKTTVVAAKVKYLIEKKHIDPSKILVMSYTKKATQELESRIVLDLGCNCNVKTFHGLGWEMIRRLFYDKSPYIVDENTKKEIFKCWLKDEVFNNNTKLKNFIECFSNVYDGFNKITIGQYLRKYYNDFKSFDEYFESYKIFKLNEAKNINLQLTIKNMVEADLNKEVPITIKGEFVKSKGEAIIANTLFVNGIDYTYEKVYDEFIEDYVNYRPDFTLDIGGQKIYIEYFGLSNYQGDKLNRYNKIKEIKTTYHERHHNKFISIDYKENEDIVETLITELKKLHVKQKLRSYEEILLTMLDRNPVVELYKVQKLMLDTIENIKTNINREDFQNISVKYLKANNNDKILVNQYNFIDSFYHYYQKCLFRGSSYGFDFSDMLYYSKKYIDNERVKKYLKFEYIIIDEYQDISQDRYELLEKVLELSSAKLCVVGDDWQSIYGFNGSKVDYIINFGKSFEGAKSFGLATTYRNSQQLLDVSGKFIMRNSRQIVKQLKSQKYSPYPIVIKEFDELYENSSLKYVIKYIHNRYKNHNILILSRRNKNIEAIFLERDFFKNDLGTKVQVLDYKDLEVDAMTIHKSKGLTFDEVVLIGMNNNFPSENTIDFWMKSLFKGDFEDEPIPYAEERRVFYVALTRTRNRVFILSNRNHNLRSSFIDELEESFGDSIEYIGN